VQALSSAATWEPAGGTLGELTKASLQRAEASEPLMAELRARAFDQPAAKPFAGALRGSTVSVIAEVKRASPSKGAIAPGLNAAQQASRYVAGGAAAISVLTEPTRFGGSLDDLASVAAAVAVPVIRKDFIVAPVQLWEARAAGASAALLIVRALAPDLLQRLVDSAQEAGLALLVEVRDEGELARALQVGAGVIGVNNRNLETLVIDPTTAPRLIRSIPVACIAVAESGISRVEDVLPAAAAGADAILVGGAISAASDARAAVAALTVVPRRTR
jgi:indole-3-glycerol phosphate synthase